ncbi:ATP-dependent DNA helicase UvrD2 [Paludibacter sp. 221]|uniref:helix-turn-helix domain-containing protein n=1 Tax=Paludibacter sp. 221 TaxID=2302939 RepID=UPI0013D56299|nr:HRDC domain-containing protein [Paludibacter sp. 221]NDV46048.1 ATP-dependent DNA helicase UvrD2 [Paludibacter sp. 221]
MEPVSSFYRFASEFALYTNRSIFLTGKAGTGKTTFLHRLKEETKKQMAVVAPTGVAAINAGGTTMHSFFQLPFAPFIPTPEGRKELIGKVHMHGFRRKVLQELELLVIDEISMVRADVLDAVDTILRHFRYRYNEPFGGVQLIFIGDMFQLSPVTTEAEWKLLSEHYPSPYFFDSQVIGLQPPLYIELDKIYRQSNADFIRVLNEVRNNCLSADGLKLLQSRYNPRFRPSQDDTYITLTTHNYKADSINTVELKKLRGKTYTFEAEVKGEYPEKIYPTDKSLELKIGAKVMFIKNDAETPRRYYNGKIGVIEDINKEDGILIKCPEDDELISLHRDVWRNIRYNANPNTKQIEEEELGEFIQYPLRLAWAITIHKSQGLTFDKAVIDAGDAFVSGQVYVALSRCRSLEGMVLLSKINPHSIQNDSKILNYEQNKLHENILEKQLEESKRLYRRFVLHSLFEFSNLEGQALYLLNTTRELESWFNEETIPYLQSILQQIKEVREVAIKFQSQLQKIQNESPVDEGFMQSRINSASKFFIEKLDELLVFLNDCPVVCEGKKHANEFNDSMKTLFANVSQKCFLLDGLKDEFGVEDYFILKNTFIVPEFEIDSYTKNAPVKSSTGTYHPELYKNLTLLRNELCERYDVAPHQIARAKTLIEISNFLPLTEKELLQIKSFGPTKVQKYGSEFLNVLQAYCSENNLTSQMYKKEASKPRKSKKTTEKKSKPIKVDSKQVTLDLYLHGKNINEIAEERGLAISTIVTHLIDFIDFEVNVRDFISDERFEETLKIVEKAEKKKQSFYVKLKDFLSPVELQFFMAWRRRQFAQK